MFKTHIYEMGEYKPPLEGRNPDEFLLLDFNERTVPVNPKIKQAIIDYVKNDQLQCYPSYGNLIEKLALYAGVRQQQVMITNGSDQGIDIIIRAVCRENDEVIIPGPSFAMYKQAAMVENVKIIEPAYTKEDGFPTNKILDTISDRTKLIIIPNPNNPTGTSVSQDDILKIICHAPDAAILVDECYFEYTKCSVKDHIEKYKNLLITRTFSKTWGLPSVRLGYILTAAENIIQLLKIRGPYDMNQIAKVAVSAALDDPSYVQEYVKEVLLYSAPLFKQFLRKKKISFWPSSANFLFTLPENPEELSDNLRKKGVLVRPKKDANGNLALRITIGTVKQTKRLIDILEEILD